MEKEKVEDEQAESDILHVLHFENSRATRFVIKFQNVIIITDGLNVITF